MKKVSKPAIKTSSGKVVTGRKGDHHPDIPATGKRGFLLSDGKFVGREEAAKVATKAGQSKGMTSKYLHTSNLKK